MSNADTIVHLKPEHILAEGNARYGLLAYEVNARANSILEAGEVLTPVDVEEIEGAKRGEPTHRLRSGFYRHAAVSKLNKEQNAGLLLPAIVRAPVDPVTRLKLQLTENIERKNLSPMDSAVAIKQALDSGMDTEAVCKLFSRAGGRKGITITPASPAYIKMTLSFLDLPKTIQERIHDGRVGVGAAYELTKVEPADRQRVLDRAEKDRISALDREEMDAKKLEDAEAKLKAEQEKESAAAAALALAESEAAAAAAALKAKQAEVVEAYKVAKTAKGNDKKAAEEHHKAIEADTRGADKRAHLAAAALKKLKDRAEAAAKSAAEKASKVKETKAAQPKVAPAAKGKKSIGSTDIVKAAKAEGASRGVKPLTLSEIKDMIKELQLPGTYPKVVRIGEAIKSCMDGVTTPKMLCEDLAIVTGERPSPVTVVKARTVKK